MSTKLNAGKTWVVKVGSSLLTNHGAGLDYALAQRWADDIASLRSEGFDIVLVSSGAVAEGMQRLGLKERPHSVHELQAAAAVGQMGLVQMYEAALAQAPTCDLFISVAAVADYRPAQTSATKIKKEQHLHDDAS